MMKSFLLPESTSKIFVNVCYNDEVAQATSCPAQGKKGVQHWSIPYTISPPREDVDKGEFLPRFTLFIMSTIIVHS